MKKITLFVFSLFCQTLLFSQNLEQVLDAIKTNNLALKSAYQFKEADIHAERTSNNLLNPEAESSYQWGKPGELGNKQTFTATQSFDFPTTYYYRNKTIGHRISQRNAEYNQQRMDILLETCNLYIELVYLNQLDKELSIREEHASELFRSIQKQYEVGAVNQLDLNKARLNLMSATAEKSKVRTEKEGKQLLLNQLNGGI
ncbi:MAG: TolC family protein, partial [Bacteroidales bacterium]